MREVWLQTNRRALLLGMILPLVLIAVGLIIAFAMGSGTAGWIHWLGLGLAAIGFCLSVLVLGQLKAPRLAYQQGELQVYLRSGLPLRVPIGAIECFFLSAGAGQLPGPQGGQIAVRNLVLRVAEKATDYHHREVKPTLGGWDDGYIAIHGAWCEPLNLEVVQRLNQRLAEVQQALRDKSTVSD